MRRKLDTLIAEVQALRLEVRRQDVYPIFSSFFCFVIAQQRNIPITTCVLDIMNKQRLLDITYSN
jgi:hypothetical protein